MHYELEARRRESRPFVIVRVTPVGETREDLFSFTPHDRQAAYETLTRLNERREVTLDDSTPQVTLRQPVAGALRD